MTTDGYLIQQTEPPKKVNKYEEEELTDIPENALEGDLDYIGDVADATTVTDDDIMGGDMDDILEIDEEADDEIYDDPEEVLEVTEEDIMGAPPRPRQRPIRRPLTIYRPPPPTLGGVNY